MKLNFTKMHGCGNDYIYFNCFETKIEKPEELSIKLSNRHYGVGGDGIILIEPSNQADAKMRIFNADGSEAKMCGNGIRCVGWYLYDSGLVKKENLTIETLAGNKYLQIDVKAQQVSVDMGAPILTASQVPVISHQTSVINEPLEIDGVVYNVTCVSMGNPHCVVFVEDVHSLPLEKIGPYFEKHPMFPEQVNTEFIKVIDHETLEMRVWERGSGETLACGTGACASAVAATLLGHCKKNMPITVKLIGGNLSILYTEDTVYMTGDAQITFKGELE